MDRKKRFSKSVVILFMVFAIILSTSKTFAYWSSGVTVNSTTQSTSVVSIGDWNQAFEWDPNIIYKSGDRVIYNGNTYEANYRHSDVRPTSFWGWFFTWDRV